MFMCFLYFIQSWVVTLPRLNFKLVTAGCSRVYQHIPVLLLRDVWHISLTGDRVIKYGALQTILFHTNKQEIGML